MVRTTDAWSGRADGSAVQLSEPRGDGAEGSSAAGHPAAGERGAGAAVTRLRAPLCPDRPGLNRAGEVATGIAPAGVLLGALGAATDGATDLQYAVPLVRRSVDGRTGLGRDGVHQEPRAAARRRHCPRFPVRHPGRPGGEAAAVD